MEFLIKIGKNEGFFVHQCFASVFLPIQPFATSKLTSHSPFKSQLSALSKPFFSPKLALLYVPELWF